MKALFDKAKDGLVLRVNVYPGAGTESVVGTHGDALKVHVAAPPVSGRANQALLSLLARELDVDSSTLEITSGANTRTKRVKITGMEPEDLEKRLRILVQEAGTRGPRNRRR